MATLPRMKPPYTPPGVSAAPAALTRAASDFDSGLNTSNAWTEHLEREHSLSDDETPGDEMQQRGLPARALYDFEGKPEFQELTVRAGDSLDVLKEVLADGWSLARHRGDVGLIPRAYYIMLIPNPLVVAWGSHSVTLPVASPLRYLISICEQFTADFVTPPSVDAEAAFTRSREASQNSITPKNSPRSAVQPLPSEPQALLPQTTGEWFTAFPSFRRSLLGGKALNRFSSFVTTGAEAWVLHGSETAEDEAHAGIPAPHVRIMSNESDYGADLDTDEDDSAVRLSRIDISEADRHFVDAGPSWKPKVPPFRVLVHSPSKRASSITGAYTIYSVTSLFVPPAASDDDDYNEPSSPTRITVHRRFSHFVFLHTALTRRLPGLSLPPLPEKQYSGRFSDAFVEARRGDLQRYINKVVRHPVARYAEVLTFFLGCESDIEWKRQLPQHLAMQPAGPNFYARVYHPAFNLDADDAADTVERFENHTKAVSRGVQQLRSVFGKIRAARLEMSSAERLLSYSLLSLITSTPLATSAVPPISEEGDEDDSDDAATSRGLMNSDGAWCWREDCSECLWLSKAMQKTTDTLQGVADLYDDHARRTLLASHEALKDVAHPSSLYAPIVDTHRETLSRYKEATSAPVGAFRFRTLVSFAYARQGDEDMAARCETVLNTTMAEFETYHAQKREDFERITREHLDDEIAFYERVLGRLRSARHAFDMPHETGKIPEPRRPSIYERELAEPRLSAAHLPQPCPHVFDSTPMRPVSAAIQGGVGMLLGGVAGGMISPAVGRASVFGKFW